MSPSKGQLSEVKAAAAIECGRLVLLENDMIAITGFRFHCVQNKAGFFLKVLYHLIADEHMDSGRPLLVNLADLLRRNTEKLSNFFC